MGRARHSQKPVGPVVNSEDLQNNQSHNLLKKNHAEADNHPTLSRN
jgi:hypothetical protein